MLKIVNSSEFKKEIQSGTVVVDFFATWCGSCKMLSPVLEGLSNEMQGKAKIIKVDVDASSDLANQFQITTVPTMKIFKDGQNVDTLVGFLPKAKIQRTIEANL